MPTSIKDAKYAVVGHSPDHGAGILFWTTTEWEAEILRREVIAANGEAKISYVVRWPPIFRPIARLLGFELL